MKKSSLTLRALVEGAVFVALAQVLSYLKLFELPQGGSITLSREAKEAMNEHFPKQ